ncbi:hypothetical protein JEQ12_006653 [Ovis aries]|uniref:G-protein coupled receptors family 1 profile domain-containing protein n=1 Tax=Ovis aries TaxID=9940 RepID=A0A835ZUE5_SHEEP|nr:hypothetical protein JEQ12_006653 [Ovis aries]
MKGRCLPPWGLAGIEASFPSYSTKGPRGPWLDTEDLSWAPALEDESVTLSSTRARVRLSAVATGAQSSEFRLRTVTPNAGRAGTMVGSRHRKKPSERFLADSRRFLEEEGSGGCVFSGGLRRRRDSQGYSNGLIRTGDTVEIKLWLVGCSSLTGESNPGLRIGSVESATGPQGKYRIKQNYAVQAIRSFTFSLMPRTFPISTIIAASYGRIVWTLLRIRAAAERGKAFSTCAAHLAVVSLFYGTLFFMYVRTGAASSISFNKVVSIFYSIVTPMLNPLIYSLRNQENHCFSLLTMGLPDGLTSPGSGPETQAAEVPTARLFTPHATVKQQRHGNLRTRCPSELTNRGGSAAVRRHS